MTGSFFSLIASDFKRAYPTHSRAQVVIRGAFNTSLHACVLVRICQCSPGWAFPVFRRLLVALHSMDVGRGFSIGHGLSLPHPVNIVIGSGVRAGRDLSIFQGVTLGTANGFYPVLEDLVSIYPNAVIVGNVFISSGSKIKALTFIGSRELLVKVER